MSQYVDAIAQRLLNAQTTRTPCAPPSQDFAEFDVATAYAVQAKIFQMRQEGQNKGDRPVQTVGHKIGLTSPAIQQWLGVNEPDFGVLVDDMVVADGAKAPTERLLQPRVEAEVAFVLREDLEGPGITAAAVIQATDYVLPALEIIDSRIADWEITFEDTIADNASSGLFVLGNQPRKLEAVDLRLAGMKLSKNGAIVATGVGAACLGHPVNAVVWLANRIGRFGQSLSRGDVILSGALGPVTDVSAGDFVSTHIAGLGSVSVRF